MTETTTKLTPDQARRRIKAYLIDKYVLLDDPATAAEIDLWTVAQAHSYGWFGDGSKGQVAWEGGPFEWVHDLCEDVAQGKLDLGPYYLECSTSWCVALYPK